MQINKIYISRIWSDSELKGEIEFAGKNGTIEIKLDNEKTKEIIAIIASQLVKTSKEIADAMTVECIEMENELKLIKE